MKRFLSRRIFTLTLLSAFLLTPSAYLLEERALLPVAKAATEIQSKEKKQGTFDPFIRTELFFGRNIAGGGEVSKQDFNKFLEEFITPRFPDGLTVLNGRGQFLNSSGDVERERTILLILLYPVSARKEKHTKIEEIRDEYKSRFQQQSVLRVDDPPPSGFHSKELEGYEALWRFTPSDGVNRHISIFGCRPDKGSPRYTPCHTKALCLGDLGATY